MTSNTSFGLAIFNDTKIRRAWHNDEWWFSVVDVVEALTGSANPRNYWSMLKTREEEQGVELSTNCVQFKMKADDGKLRETDCANTEGIFRIIQSIPSPKAEPFKLWLAKTGYERVQEIENPELAQNRARQYYELKGYPKEWIEKRLRGIVIRQELTDEWKERGVSKEEDFSILTNEITKATFGMTVQEYKDFKSLKKSNQNLRDHMGDWEIIFTMIGEKATTDITRSRDTKQFEEHKTAANRGGRIAHIARTELEKETGTSALSRKNFLSLEKEPVQRKKLS